MIDRHLNLVSAKSQTAELLMKLRLVNEALARSTSPALPAPRPSITLAPWPAHEDRPGFHPGEYGNAPVAAATPRATAAMSELEKQERVDQQPTLSELEKQQPVDQQPDRGVAESLALYQQAVRDFPDTPDTLNLPSVPANPQPGPFSSPIEDDAHA